MAQSATVMAFRKRLSKRGYINISIFRLIEYADCYEVRAVEPLAGSLVNIKLSLMEMNVMFR